MPQEKKINGLVKVYTKAKMEGKKYQKNKAAE